MRLFDPPKLSAIDWLPPDLLSEFRVAYSPIAASLVDVCPVSLCYATVQTQSFWDISIDTLEELTNRDHATRCIAFMVERIESRGLRLFFGICVPSSV